MSRETTKREIEITKTETVDVTIITCDGCGVTNEVHDRPAENFFDGWGRSDPEDISTFEVHHHIVYRDFCPTCWKKINRCVNSIQRKMKREKTNHSSKSH